MTGSVSNDEPAMRRPLSISIIAVLLVLYGLVTLVPKVVLLLSPEVYRNTADLTGAMTSGGFIRLGFAFHVVYSFLASLITVVAGVFLWRGRNWARWLALAWMALSLGLVFLLLGPVTSFYIKIPLFLVMAYFLTTRRAAAFLGGKTGS